MFSSEDRPCLRLGSRLPAARDLPGMAPKQYVGGLLAPSGDELNKIFDLAGTRNQQPVVKVQTVARMGIDAQRSGASELPDRAVAVRRAQGARRKAMSVRIVDDEQRSDRPHSGPCNLRRTDDGRAQQDPCALRVAAEPGPRYRASGAAAARPGGRLAQPPLPPEAAYVGLGLRCGGSTMCTDIARAAAPFLRPPRARNAALCTLTTDC